MSAAGRSLVWLAAAAIPACLPAIAFGQSETRISADASANVGYSSNPFSDVGTDTGSGVAQIRVSPKIKILTERTILILSGDVDYQRYFRRYTDSADFGTGVDYAATPSERLKTHLNLRFDSAIVGRNQFSNGPIDPNLPVPPVLAGTDIALFGTHGRRRTFRANGDVSYTLSARDSLSAGAYYVRSRYSQSGGVAALNDYDGFGGSAGYNRAVSAHLQLGAQASVARYQYTSGLSNTTVYSAQGVFVDVLSPHWTASGALGVSFTTGRIGGNKATLSGNLRLCRATDRTSLCLTASRAVLPTGFAGTQTETAVGLDYSYRLSERSRVFASVSYSKNGNSQLLVLGQNEYLRTSAGYDHQLTQRVSLVATARYAKIYGGLLNRRADTGGLLGVAVKVGALK